MRARLLENHAVRSENGTPKVMLCWMCLTSDADVRFQTHVLMIYDLVSGAVAVVQDTKRGDPRPVLSVGLTL